MKQFHCSSDIIREFANRAVSARFETFAIINQNNLLGQIYLITQYIIHIFDITG